MRGSYRFLAARMRSIPSILVMALLMGALLSPVSVAADAESTPVTFTAMGCGPYRTKIPGSQRRLTRSLKTLNEDTDPGSFLVHLGDIFQGDLKAKKVDYERVSGMFTAPANRVPTFFVPGDNEVVDQCKNKLGNQCNNESADRCKNISGDKCENELLDQCNIEKARTCWKHHFLRFDEKREQEYLGTVDRQDDREENFAFVEGRVLFIGINKVGIKKKNGWGNEKKLTQCEEMKKVWEDAAEWIKASYKKNLSQVDAVVVLAQAAPFGLGDQVVDALTHVSTSGNGIHLLYLHADDHQYCGVQRDWGYQLMVDQIGGSENDIVRVTVNSQEKKIEDVFLFRNMQDVVLPTPPSCKKEKGFNGGKAPDACWHP